MNEDQNEKIDLVLVLVRTLCNSELLFFPSDAVEMLRLWVVMGPGINIKLKMKVAFKMVHV